MGSSVSRYTNESLSRLPDSGKLRIVTKIAEHDSGIPPGCCSRHAASRGSALRFAPRLLSGIPIGMRRRLRREKPYKTMDSILDGRYVIDQAPSLERGRGVQTTWSVPLCESVVYFGVERPVG